MADKARWCPLIDIEREVRVEYQGELNKKTSAPSFATVAAKLMESSHEHDSTTTSNGLVVLCGIALRWRLRRAIPKAGNKMTVHAY